MKKFVFLFLSVFVMISAIAQVTTSSISGKVVDEKGQPLIGATVIAKHISSGTQYGSAVDAKGMYRLQNLRPGSGYTVTFQLLGYKTTEFKDITLALAENYALNVTLVESSTDIETVVVKGKGKSNMNSDQAGAVTNINSKSIEIMPSINRSINDMTRLTPQANGSAIGGGNYRQNFLSVDGAPFNNSFGIGQNMPANGSPISLDALDQISVNVTPYDVRQSNFIGAAINAVTRSGDNLFRGSAYYYFNNENFKGNKVGNQTFEKAKSQYNMFGVRLGGPIVKDKLFFFVNYEMEREERPASMSRAATAEAPYTDGKNNIARPTTTELDNIKSFLINKHGYNPGDYQDYSAESPGYKFLARLDWNITKNHRFNVRYSQTKAKTPSNASTSVTGLASKPYGSMKRTDMSALMFSNTRYYQETNYSSFAAELNSTFFGRFNNTLRATYTHQNEPRSTDAGDFPFVDILKDSKPFTSFGTELFSFGNLRDVKTFSITDDFTWSSGIHNFMGGISFETNKTENGFQRFGTGYYAFDSWEAFEKGEKATVFGITHSNAEGFKQQFPSFKYKQLAVYFQDEISFSQYFKLNAGVRLDFPLYPDINHSYNEAVAKNPVNGISYNTATLPKTSMLFSPRLSFNYDILKDRSLVLRGGTGIFTGRLPFVWIVAQSSDAGVLQSTYTVAGQDKTPNFHPDRIGILNEIYPGGVSSIPAIPQSIVVMDKGFKMPKTWKTSIALDAQLPFGIKGSAEFIVNKDINAAVFKNRGIVDPKAWANGTNDNRMIYPSNRYYDSKLQNIYTIENGKSGGYYWSSTIKLEKSFRFGLSAMAAYTHSEGKNYTDGSGDQVGSAWQNNVTVNGANSEELSYANYIIPNKVIAAINFRSRDYAKFMSTSIGLFYEGGAMGRFSYIYNGGISNDNSYSSLIYVPKDASEIDFVEYTPNGWKQPYTTAAQSKDFFAYIDQDDYLRTRKGQYAQRNGAIYPWINKFDLKIAQDFFVNVAGRRNTITVALDVMNVGNLLNKNWGNEYKKFTYDTPYLLKQEGKSVVGEKPKYKLEVDGNSPKNETFNKFLGFSSTYSMQFSVRYTF